MLFTTTKHLVSFLPIAVAHLYGAAACSSAARRPSLPACGLTPKAANLPLLLASIVFGGGTGHNSVTSRRRPQVIFVLRHSGEHRCPVHLQIAGLFRQRDAALVLADAGGPPSGAFRSGSAFSD